jgi:hypothetical protein
VFSEIVGVGAVDDRVEPSLLGDGDQPKPQLGLAEVTPIRGVAEVSGIFQLVGVHLQQGHLEPPRQLDCVPMLHFRI